MQIQFDHSHFSQFANQFDNFCFLTVKIDGQNDFFSSLKKKNIFCLTPHCSLQRSTECTHNFRDSRWTCLRVSLAPRSQQSTHRASLRYNAMCSWAVSATHSKHRVFSASDFPFCWETQQLSEEYEMETLTVIAFNVQKQKQQKKR